ncbi:MAG: hypothetical protein Ct9H300mP18_06270 [Candidatus Neomarinimicrobiota bacterium]|nr:MAG: hypothetical protein Ct9H300mP18_06270 [Candidatus Neomarinimicrobiota bacterium]
MENQKCQNIKKAFMNPKVNDLSFDFVGGANFFFLFYPLPFFNPFSDHGWFTALN